MIANTLLLAITTICSIIILIILSRFNLEIRKIEESFKLKLDKKVLEIKEEIKEEILKELKL